MSSLLLTGEIGYAEHSYKIAGVTVLAELPVNFEGMPGLTLPHPLILGRSVTDAEGRFTIEYTPAESETSFTCLASCHGATVRCFDVDQRELFKFTQVRPVGEETLLLNLPDLDLNQYDLPLQELATCMEEYQIVHLDQLARELSTMSPRGVFSNWSVEHRLLVLEALENSLLDPDGMLNEFGFRPKLRQLVDPEKRDALRRDIMQQDSMQLVEAFDKAIDLSYLVEGNLTHRPVPVHPAPIRDNDLVQGVHKFIGKKFGDSVAKWERDYLDIFPWYRDPIQSYRDYLLEIWRKKAANQLKGQTLNETGAVQQLQNRFHQDFRTRGTTSEPVNKLLSEILKKILLAPAGSGFGFALPVADIEEQGELSHREYLDYLINLTGKSQEELEKRYRLNLSRSDLDTSTPVQLNIETLQRFFTDSFQSLYDPHNILPPLAGNGHTIINEYTYRHQQHGPFFLQYEEWLEREEPFYGENYFDLRSTFFLYHDPAERTSLFNRTQPLDAFANNNQLKSKYRPARLPATIPHSRKEEILSQWARMLLEVQDRLNAAHRDFFGGFYGEAENKYSALLKLVFELEREAGGLVDTELGVYNVPAVASWQRSFKIKDPDTLKEFEQKYHLSFRTSLSGNMGVSWTSSDVNIAKVPYLVDLLYYRLIPFCIAESRLAQGKFREAIQGGGITLAVSSIHHRTVEKGLSQIARFKVWTGPTPVEPGSKKTPQSEVWWPLIENTGSLPYATDYGMDKPETWEGDYFHFPANKTETAFYKLKLGEALLEWADTLYRTDQPESKARARELYKGVLFLHGEDPQISPRWDTRGFGKLPFDFFEIKRNPAISIQINRARIGFDQLNAGLNYYGFPPDFLPPVRYRILKEAALKFAASAKSAQNDYLSYMQKYEQSVIDQMTAQNMVEKASYAIQIAAEQVELVDFAVGEAEKQVVNVKAQIEAKRKEIKDADGFFEQVKSFFGGMKDAAVGLGKSFLGEMETGAAAGGAGGMDWKAMYKVVSSKGATGASAAGLTGGMALMAGYGAFAYAGYMSMSSMADAAAKRGGELKALETVALPAARKMVELKKRERNIASLQKAIAEADYNFGKRLLAFYDYRFLNKAFWQQLSAFTNRLMRRYIDLGGKTAWYAERALSFEINKEIRLVSFDYFPRALRGVTGVDTLQLHLSELEATRIYSLSQTIPVKHSWSLAKDFPLALGQLKKNGICQFTTSQQSFNTIYPGVYGYRLRCVSIGVTYADEFMPHKGMITNNGFSLVSDNKGQLNRLLRYPDALPLSEFNMRGDMLVYELPDETLLPFEGSGIDTQWELSLARIGNFSSLENLTDVLITFDMRASYSAALQAKHQTLLPTKWNKSLLLSGKEIDLKKFMKFKKDGGLLEIRFDPAHVADNVLEKDRTISLLGMIMGGTNGAPVVASLRADKDNVAVDFDFDHGVALTNSGFLNGSNGGVSLPLNPITGLSANQELVFEIDAAENPGIDFSDLADIQLYVEYEAEG